MDGAFEVKGEKFVVISKKEYDSLIDSFIWLMALEAAGVDNWSGYGHAREIMRGKEG